MASHEKFHYQSLSELRAQIEALHVDIALTEDLRPLLAPVRVGGLTAPNAMAVLPMEGCDSEPDGSPSELVTRRYMRFAGGGAGLLWWEACAVAEEGRANELQMMLTKGNLPAFAALVKQANAEASTPERRKPTAPVNVLQLTHSGRYSRPHGHKAAPIVPQHDPILDPRVGLSPDAPVVTDAYLDDLIGKYVASAKLAQEAGFDGVDLKSCHRYLLSELLASHTRAGKYGGSFENRTRFLRDVIDAVRAEVGKDFILACRFNVFDAHPYPYGFGEDKQDLWKFDPEEPMALVRMLRDKGVGLLSNSAGNPYYIYPQVTRPFDLSSMGVPVPDEHPLESVARLFAFTAPYPERSEGRARGGQRLYVAATVFPQRGRGQPCGRRLQLCGPWPQQLCLSGCAARHYPARGDGARQVLHHLLQVHADQCATMAAAACVVRDAKVYAPPLQAVPRRGGSEGSKMSEQRVSRVGRVVAEGQTDFLTREVPAPAAGEGGHPHPRQRAVWQPTCTSSRPSTPAVPPARDGGA